MSSGGKESKYLQYLPVIYQGKADGTAASFLGRFLKAFEKILSGIPDDETAKPPAGGIEEIKGIEEVLDCIHDKFDPAKTPSEFLSWLAGWVALVLKEGEGWDEKKKRNHIAQIIPLYRKRGTREGLEEYIRIYVGEQIKVTINEFLLPLQVGVASTVGVDTTIGSGRPYYFHVYMDMPTPDPRLLERKRQAIIDIINQEKPAHTYYGLTIHVPTMQIGVHSTVGADTLLGGEKDSSAF